MWHFLDLVRAIVRGIIVDGLMTRPEGYAAVDDEDYREWLTRHGAGPETIESPLVRVVYDLVFGYEHGDADRPRFAAGTGLLLSGKMFFDYRGAVFWKMTRAWAKWCSRRSTTRCAHAVSSSDSSTAWTASD